MALGGARPGAGRKKGFAAIQSEKLREFLVEQVLKEKGPIIKALVEKAKSGDTQAIKEVLERTIGKVKDQGDLNVNIKHELDVPDDTYRVIIERAARSIKVIGD